MDEQAGQSAFNLSESASAAGADTLSVRIAERVGSAGELSPAVPSGTGLRLAEPPTTQPQSAKSQSATFSVWSRHYTVRLMLMDGLVGMLAVIASAVLFPGIISFSATKLAVLLIGATLAWPLMIGLNRGYERSTIGVSMIMSPMASSTSRGQ